MAQEGSRNHSRSQTWTFQPIQHDCKQAEYFAVLHAAHIMDVIDPAEAMRARKGDLLARHALILFKRATHPGIHHVKRAKKERRAVAKGRRDARPAETRGKAITDSDSSSQSGDGILIAKLIRELGETLPNPAQEPEGPAEARQSIDDYPISDLGSI